MAQLSRPFLNVNFSNCCLLCEKELSGKTVKFTDKGWGTLKSNAGKWRNLNIPIDDPCHLFPTVHKNVVDAASAFGDAHEGCRIKFSTKYELFANRYDSIQLDEKRITVEDERRPSNHSSSHRVGTRNATEQLNDRTCFVCDIMQSIDDQPYNEGGLGTSTKSCEKIIERTKIFLSDSSLAHHQAACRFVRQAGGLDNAEKVFYHQKCYIR